MLRYTHLYITSYAPSDLSNTRPLYITSHLFNTGEYCCPLTSAQ